MWLVFKYYYISCWYFSIWSMRLLFEYCKIWCEYFNMRSGFNYFSMYSLNVHVIFFIPFLFKLILLWILFIHKLLFYYYQGISLLWRACTTNDTALAKVLIKGGADLNEVSNIVFLIYPNTLLVNNIYYKHQHHLFD